MKGQGLANDTTERSKNGPGKFIASKVRASSQAALTAAIGQSSNTQQTATNNVPISSIGLSETSKLSEKDIQVCFYNDRINSDKSLSYHVKTDK